MALERMNGPRASTAFFLSQQQKTMEQVGSSGLRGIPMHIIWHEGGNQEART